MSYKCGDVILVPFPFTDQTTVKKRPAVVVSNAEYNEERPDLIVMPITTARIAGEEYGEVEVVEWRRARLLNPSVIKPVIATIERQLVIRRLGQLHPDDRQSLVAQNPRFIGS